MNIQAKLNDYSFVFAVCVGLWLFERGERRRMIYPLSPRVSEGEAWRVARRGGYVVRWGWYVVLTWERASVEHGNHGRPHTPDTPGGGSV